MSTTAFQRFLAELRRRHIFRAAAVYLAAGFVVLQLADLVIEPLGLPPWTMGLLIILGVVGFLLTMALTWAFELTPDGVRRTEDADRGGSAAAPSAVLASSPTPSAPTKQLRHRSAAAVTVLVVLAAGAWYARGRVDTPPQTVEAGRVAVMPFRVSGAAPELAYLHEGLVDLMGALLAERAAVPTVAPRVLLHELGTDGGGPAAESELVAAAQRVGAGRVLLGEVVGRPDRLTITATLRPVDDPEIVLRASVTGSEAELDVLVDQLAAELLAREFVDPAGYAGFMQRVPLTALREYLEGVSLHRRARYADAVKHYRQALAIDSSFALAAIGLQSAAVWAPATVSQDELQAVRSIAWEHRDRLNATDRLFVIALLGPDFPAISAPADLLRAVEEALASAPDRPELWYEYGDLFFHEGRAIGYLDAGERARRAFATARTIAPDHIEGEHHLLGLALEAGDTVLFNDASARLLELDSMNDMRVHIAGLRALFYDDSEHWDIVRDEVARAPATYIYDVVASALRVGRALSTSSTSHVRPSGKRRRSRLPMTHAQRCSSSCTTPAVPMRRSRPCCAATNVPRRPITHGWNRFSSRSG